MKKSNPTASALEKVMKEFNALVGGRQNLNMQDLVDLRKHAKLRTDLSLPDDELSAEQKIWKTLYNSLDEQMEKGLGHDEKAKIDGLLQDMANLTTVQRALELKIKRHGDKDNGRFLFYTFLIVGFLISWVLTGSFWWAVILGLISSVVGLFVGASIFESGYSQGYLGKYLDKLRRFTGSDSLKKAANNMVSKSVGVDELEKVDNDPSKIADLNKKLNELFDQQHAYMALPFDKDATYREKSDALSDEMLNAKKTNEEHVQTAEIIIRLADKITEIGINPLRKVNDSIQQILVELKKDIATIRGEQKRDKLSKWFDASNDFYLNRRIIANYTISSVEWDKRIPEAIIKNKGDITVNMPMDFATEMQKSAQITKDAQEKDKKLNETRKKLANEVFGILE